MMAPMPTKPSDLVFENENLKLFVEKAAHLQEKKFRLQDHMYHLLITPKKKTMPLLSDILSFLQMGFLFILNNIKQFYKPTDENIAFMTIHQSSLTNSLNTGGFLLQDDTSSTDMVNLMLSMLNQYLISHKSIELDKTFKVYLKILSVNHSKLKRIQRPKPKKLKTTLGCSKQLFQAKWAIDVPQIIDFFKNKCIYLCTILGVAQHDYFISNLKDKRYLYMAQINSKLKKKQKHALQLILNDLEQLLCVISYNEDLSTIEILEQLSKALKCQFFVFEGSVKNNNKILIQVPSIFDCSLKPMFFYKPYNSDHVIFIRNINSYFIANGKTCLICKRYFKSPFYTHYCKQIKNNCCFACHRSFQKTTTYIHSDLRKFFCDSKLLSNLNTKCKLCNLTIYSKECEIGHRKLCCSRGFFGFKCDICNHFTYRSGSTDSTALKNEHQCKMLRSCKYCHKQKEDNHLCTLLQEKYCDYNTRLVFLVLEIVENDPIFALMYVENLLLRGDFANVVITDSSEIENEFRPEHLSYDFFKNIQVESDKKKFKRKKKRESDDLKLLKNKQIDAAEIFQRRFLSYIFNTFEVDTTVIVYDSDFEMVSVCTFVFSK